MDKFSTFTIRTVRKATQFFALFLTNAYMAAYVRGEMYQGAFKSICLPFLYCHSCPSATFACPIGTLQHYAVIRRVPFFLLGHIGLFALLLGRMSCGWLCPGGLIQDLLAQLSEKKIKIPRAFYALRYLALGGLVVLVPYLTGEHWFSKLCPIGTLVAGIPWALWNPIDPTTGNPTIAPGTLGVLFAIKLALLLAFIALAILAKRPFCRYACPMGVILGFFNRFSLIRLSVDQECDDCDTCQKHCPMGIKVSDDPNHPDCVRCFTCTSVCKHVHIEAPLVAFLRMKQATRSVEEKK
jgi:ferredoxin-type protein NapH